VTSLVGIIDTADDRAACCHPAVPFADACRGRFGPYRERGPLRSCVCGSRQRSSVSFGERCAGQTRPCA
jgi:hypothetical protein